MSAAAKTPAIPRLAATVLLVRDDPFQVLMVRRTARRIDAFSSALVFPGGVVDPEDRSAGWLDHVDGADGLAEEERALRVAACRETFEEAGLLLARAPREAVPAPARGEAPGFPDLVRAAGVRLPLQDLVHFAHWITPEMAPRRFDTHFYLCRAPDGAEAVCDGHEAVSLEWVSPRDLLARTDAGGGHIVFPTRVNLTRLAESEDVAAALAAARARERFTVRPNHELRDGRLRISIPPEAGYALTEEWITP